MKKPPEAVRHQDPEHVDTKTHRREIAESIDEHGYEDLPQTNLRKMKEYQSGMYHELMTPHERE